MIQLRNPASYYEEDFHRHEFFTEEGELICTIEFDDIEDEGHRKLMCEVTVYWHMGTDKKEPILAYETANLLTKGHKSTGIAAIIFELEESGLLANWKEGFKVATFLSTTHHRATSSQGDWLTWKESTADDTPYLLKPFIASTGVTVLYAPMGSNKSMFALRLALAVATGDGIFGVKPRETGPVLYVDFEDTPDPHKFRLTAFARILGIKEEGLKGLLYHERVTKNMKDARRRLRNLVRDHGIKLVVIDSIGLARGTDVSGSEATIKLFKMFNAMGASVLAIDHMTKEDNKRVWTGKMNAAEATPIGSQFTQSSARLAWFMNLLPDSEPDHKKFNMFNTKNNHDRTQDPFGMTLDMTSDKNNQIFTAEFKKQDITHFVVKHNEQTGEKTKDMVMLEAHFREGRSTLGVVTGLTGTTLAKLSGVPRGSVGRILTESDFWTQQVGSKQYIISNDGMELATLLWGDDNG